MLTSLKEPEWKSVKAMPYVTHIANDWVPLKSEEISQACQDAARQIATQAGVGYKPLMMGTRVIVVSDTEEAEQDNLNNNTLLKVAHQW